ncbi:MAG: tRNA threonylcarbamoyladenosine dehydratase [Acidaminococcaceae bacterium]|nr:tRNA threonylcarbamoyladenosine dehydratase [Acidaminococcaceae bacterium]
MMENWLERAEELIGKENIEKLQNATVLVFGLGGVGGYAVEGLCRSGIGNLFLVDGDCYAPSNLNRQIGATINTLGKSKTQVMAERIAEINPACKVQVINEFYHKGDFAKFFNGKIDFVLDCIDDTDAKVDILAECVRRGIPVISAMGTGKKLQPELLKIADISKTSGCPLARSVRQKLRKEGIEKGVAVVYSEEAPQDGSMVFVPGAAGLMMASYAVRKLVEKKL